MPFGSNDTQIASLIVQAKDEATSILQGVGRELERVGQIAGGVFVGQVGYQAFYALVNGAEKFAGGMITANSTLQQFNKSLEILYGNAREAESANAFLTNFALTTPDTLANIRQGALELLSIGADLTQVLPAVGNAAAAMGTTVPVAAHALVTAVMGDFTVMRDQLKITQQALVPFGLEMDNTGHVLSSSVVPAFEAFVAKRYGDAMAAQMTTGAGAWSNFEDALQHVQTVMGRPLFDELTRDMNAMLKASGDNKQGIDTLAQAIGAGLATAAHEAYTGIQALGTELPIILAVVSTAWQNLQGAVAFATSVINTAVGGVKTFVVENVAPALYQAIGTMIVWWRQHGDDVRRVLGDLGANIQRFAKTAGDLLLGFFEVIKGVAGVAWGAIEVIFATGMEGIDSNNKRWRQMQIDGWTTMQTSTIGIVGELIKGVISLMTSNEINQAFYAFTQMVANGLISVFEGFETTIAKVMDAVGMKINAFTKSLSNWAIDVPGLGRMQITGNLPTVYTGNEAATRAAIETQRADWVKALTGPAPTPVDPRAIAQARASVDAAVQAAQADVMRMNGYMEVMKTVHTLAGDVQMGTGQWRLPGQAGQPDAFKYSYSQTEQTGRDAIDALLKSWNKTLNEKLRFQVSGPSDTKEAGGALDLRVAGAGGTDPIAQRKVLADALQQAKEQFELDRLNHASQQKLLADIAAILVDMKRAGASQLDIALERKRDMDLIMGTARQAQGQGLPAWLAASAAAQARSAGFGSTIADYGFGVRDNTAAIIASLQRQLAAAQEQIALLRSVLRAVEKTADTISRPGDAALWRRHGMPQPAL